MMASSCSSTRGRCSASISFHSPLPAGASLGYEFAYACLTCTLAVFVAQCLSALIALGKLSQDPIAPRVILHYLDDHRAAPIVRESAALALGLLRRTRPSHQADFRAPRPAP